MKNTEEVKPDNTTLFDELIFIKEEMKKAKAFMQTKEKETQELTREASIMAREFFISKLAYANNLSNFEKRICVFLLHGQSGEDALKSKFDVLNELLKVRRHIIDILGEIEEEQK